MADNFQAYKVAANEQSSSSKFNNLVQALEDACNSIDNSNISAAAAILVSKLASGSNGDFLQTVAGVPTWGPGSTPTYQTTLPSSPANGAETILVDSTTAPTYAWRFRFNSAKSSNKWDFIGGNPAIAEVTTSETTGSASYVALTTAGPVFAIPVAGDYIISTGFRKSSGISGIALMSYDIGGTAAVDANAVQVEDGGTAFTKSVSRIHKQAGLTAITLTSKYKATGGTQGFADRFITVTPIAVGG